MLERIIVLCARACGRIDRLQFVERWCRMNHSECPTAWLTDMASTGSREMLTTAEIAPGQEIFLSYGKLSNTDLLHRFGFVLENNPHGS